MNAIDGQRTPDTECVSAKARATVTAAAERLALANPDRPEDGWKLIPCISSPSHGSSLLPTRRLRPITRRSRRAQAHASRGRR